jgi:hypothetical protein
VKRKIKNKKNKNTLGLFYNGASGIDGNYRYIYGYLYYIETAWKQVQIKHEEQVKRREKERISKVFILFF